MEKYHNTHNSGIDAYHIHESGITIRFAGGSTYLYSISECGRRSVEIMRQLARKGIGLATYINQNVRNLCPEKLI